MAQPVKTITQKVFIPGVRPDEVYRAFLDPKKHAAFTGSPATGSARVGGRFTAWDGYISGVNRELVDGRRIVQDWRTTEWPEGAAPSTAAFTFRPLRSGTEVTLRHSNVPAEQADSYRQGWIDYYWEPLKAYFKGRQGPPQAR
jgi:activator of HSP90 ATPase